jgi:RNA polymerase sigma-70 factor (ECF subfamily)
LRAAALPPFRPAAFFWALVPPWRELERDGDEPDPDFLPPRLDAPGEFEILAARSFDIPFSFSFSYCFSFLTLARLFGIPPLAVGRLNVVPGSLGMKRAARAQSACDDRRLRRRIPTVNAATTTLPALGRGRPTFAAVVEAELDSVHGYLLFLTGDRDVAEDLTGATFEKAFRSWRRFDPRRGTARAWLCGIARNVALDHFRSEQRRLRREARYAREATAAAEPAWGEGAVAAALGELSPAEREVVALRVLLDLDGPTTARILGISATACSTRLSRAMKRLEELMSDVRV